MGTITVTMDTDNATTNIMPHYSPPWQCQWRSGNLNYVKFKCITYWACQSVKSSPCLKGRDLQNDFLINVYTYVHEYD